MYESQFVSLGVARLRVIDLENGDQPFAIEDGDRVVVFNGEIYNHAALRTELESLGHRFRSRSDTEVVLRAFRQWGTDCFARLRGMFAVALWTESEQRLVLARDRLGIKPLYLYRRGQDLYFGSELKALFEHPGVERRLCLRGLGYYLSLNYVPCPYTLVEGIEKLPPGNWLEWRDGRIQSQPYWQIDFQPRARSLDTAKEEFDGLLESAVREHLIADVPLGVWASGGLDSTSILHYASQASTSRLKTFSVSFRGRSFDESEYFRRVARDYGTEHYEMDVNAGLDLTGTLEDLAYYSDEPSADAGALPVWYLSRLSREHVTVALSGEGADELFGGYATYLADRYARLLRHVPAGVRRLALRLIDCWPVSDDKVSLEYKVKRFLRGSLLEPAEAHLYWNGAFSEEEKHRLHLLDGQLRSSSLLDTLPARAREAEPLSQYMWLDQRYYLADDILYKCDRMSMAHGLEVRPPFLDHRIVEFAAGLPENFKIHAGRGKFVLRELMRGKLPPSVLRRKKEGFDIPAHEWLRGALRPLLLDTLTRDRVEATGIFAWPAIEGLIRDHLERRANLGYHLWGLLTLFLWMRRWEIQTAPGGQDPQRILAGVSATRSL